VATVWACFWAQCSMHMYLQCYKQLHNVKRQDKEIAPIVHRKQQIPILFLSVQYFLYPMSFPFQKHTQLVSKLFPGYCPFNLLSHWTCSTLSKIEVTLPLWQSWHKVCDVVYLILLTSIQDIVWVLQCVTEMWWFCGDGRETFITRISHSQ